MTGHEERQDILSGRLEVQLRLGVPKCRDYHPQSSVDLSKTIRTLTRTKMEFMNLIISHIRRLFACVGESGVRKGDEQVGNTRQGGTDIRITANDPPSFEVQRTRSMINYIKNITFQVILSTQ
jgi:hypothetical protein